MIKLLLWFIIRFNNFFLFLDVTQHFKRDFFLGHLNYLFATLIKKLIQTVVHFRLSLVILLDKKIYICWNFDVLTVFAVDLKSFKKLINSLIDLFLCLWGGSPKTIFFGEELLSPFRKQLLYLFSPYLFSKNLSFLL